MAEVGEGTEPRRVPSSAAGDVPRAQSPGLLPRRMTPNFFGIAFGLTGLADVWQVSVPAIGVSQIVPNVLYLIAAVTWFALVVLYLAQGVRQIRADLHDVVLAPFPSLALSTGMLLSAALSRYAFDPGRVLVAVFLALTILLGGWLTGQWFAEPLTREQMHPGYFLPTVAGGFIGAGTAAAVGLHGVGEASFGVGMLCWVLLGSIIINRFFFTGMLPLPLIPTLAIELAPPAVGGWAYFQLNGARPDLFAAALGGYTILMTIVQLRFIPLYRKLPFGPILWTFTFSYAAACLNAIIWMTLKRTPGIKPLTIIILVLITGFVAAVAARSISPIAKGKLFPPLTRA